MCRTGQQATGMSWPKHHALVVSELDVSIPFRHYEITDGAWMVH